MLMNMQIGQNLLDKQITLIMLVFTVRIAASKSLFRALHACSIRCAILTSQQTWPLWTIHFETFWSKNNAPAKPQTSSSLHAIPHLIFEWKLIKFHFCSLGTSALRRPVVLKSEDVKTKTLHPVFPCRTASTLIHLCALSIEPTHTQEVSLANGVRTNVGHSFLCFRPLWGESLPSLEHYAFPARDRFPFAILGNTCIPFEYHLMLQCASMNHCDYSPRNVQKHKCKNLFCVLNMRGQVISSSIWWDLCWRNCLIWPLGELL